MPVLNTDAFLQRAIRCTSDECLIWPFARSRAGYGQVNRRKLKGVMNAHVLVCEAVKGPKPTPEHETSHTCHNGRAGCVNGSHVEWATKKENMRVRRGRPQKPWKRKLTQKEHSDLLKMYSTGLFTQAEIAAHYGLAWQSMHHVLHTPAKRV